MLLRHHVSPAAQFHSCASQKQVGGHKLWALALGSLGVVYGDIGTSPLYAFREAVKAAVAGNAAGLTVPGTAEVFGVLSLILWALIVVVTLKYVLLLLYADNRGEGGILTLTALAQKVMGTGPRFVIFLGLAGAALFYGDAAITPAISVLSAVEGVELIEPNLARFVMPLAVIILIGLFLMQKRGTKNIANLFGPVMTIWMIMMAAAGLPQILHNPNVLLAANPAFAIGFLVHHGIGALGVLGAVFLAVTGAEALYADLGHFGRRPIQLAWLYLVFPCLVINYFGQGALVLSHPEAIKNPFFLMVPHSMLLPLVGMATLATIIASQAVITGAFSLTQQAIQLGLLPRMEIQHTSMQHEGQIFMPKVNSMLMFAVVFLVLMFRGSDALASAYGIAVTGTMITTSILAYIVIWKDWKHSRAFTFMLVAPFVLVEGVFLSANLTKVYEGGVVPLLFAGFLTLLMTIWVRGSRYLSVHTRRKTVRLKELIETINLDALQRVSGTAIFLTGDAQSAPIALSQNLKHNHVLHEHNVIVTIVTMRIPKVPETQRVVIERPAPYMTTVILNYGYMETPDVPRALALANGLNVDLKDVSYFLGRRTLIADGTRGMPLWQDHIYIAMYGAATEATDFFKLPPGRVVELGLQIAV